MDIMEEIGLTKEEFDRLYELNGGFNMQFNTNHPLREEGESVYSYLQKGAESLVSENADLVASVSALAGFENGNH